MANIYNNQLLNDLHYWFPELLYNSQRFQTVQDVLRYIIQIANVNTYNIGQAHYNTYRQEYNIPYQIPYQSIYNPSPAAPVAPVAPAAPVAPVAPAAPAAPAAPLAHNALAPMPGDIPPPPRLGLGDLFNLLYADNPMDDDITTHVHISRVTMPSTGIQDNFISNILGQVLQRREPNLQDFLEQNVIIHPTQEQIDNTTMITTASTQNDNCAICQDEIEEGQYMRTINHCRHSFHQECIDTWFQRNVRCPSCRHDIRDSLDYTP